MIYWLFESFFESRALAGRMLAAATASFLLVLLLAPRVIRFLIRQKLGDVPEFNHADLNELTRHKSATPTMGGVLLVGAIFAATLLLADLSNFYIRMALLALVWLGAVGGVDDWLKLRYSAGQGSRDGLRSWEKILFQIGLAVLLAVFMYRYGGGFQPGQVSPAHSFYLPCGIRLLGISLAGYVVVTVLVMVGTSNAVNLTDGMDGLATGCVLLVAMVLLVFSWVVGVGSWAALFHMPLVGGAAEMTVLLAAIAGACLAFLWYNAPPAQVFMGDTGSLPLGGLLGFAAVVTRQELVLLLAGGVLVAEAGSVILQVTTYKLTKRPGGLEGRRLFRCAPLHHHFHLGGWPETKVVARLWIVAVLCAIVALATLPLARGAGRRDAPAGAAERKGTVDGTDAEADAAPAPAG